MYSRPDRPTTDPIADVIVIGGGSVGCSIAYYLSYAGIRTLLLERDRLAAGASGVAAGMLAPQVEAPFDDPFFDLTLRGRGDHPSLAAELLEDVGLDVECRTTGILRVAQDEAERVDLQRRLRWQAARGLRVEWVEPSQLGNYDPLLSGVTGRLLAGGLWLPDEGQVRSSRLVQALAAASVKRGATISEGTWAIGLEREGSRITGVRTPSGVLRAHTVVLAAGVWSADLGQSIGLNLPVSPVKGQILSLRAINRPPRHVIWSDHCYLVPRVDGEVILGATQEDGNYDRRPTVAGLGALTEAVLEFLPAAGQYTVEGMWAGLRPAAPDRYPIIGRAPGYDNLILATAHYRNGILLGPLTGRWVTDLIRDGSVAPEMVPFSPERFAQR